VKEPLSSRLFFPLTEGGFTYRRYDDWLGRLGDWNVVPLRELAAAATPALGLRHDVDNRLDSALELARLEHARGLRATYFVLHTAPYYDDPRLLAALRELQDDLGHEVGWHNDLATLELVQHVDAASYLREQLDRLRGAGLDIVGSAAHGSPYCHRLGYHNNYVFTGWDEPQPGFPRTDVGVKLDPAAFGLRYEAYHLPHDRYSSDSTFEGSRRSHPDNADLAGAERAIVLVHPCHWDRSRTAKSRRLTHRLAQKFG
jgi:hypothetical protein